METSCAARIEQQVSKLSNWHQGSLVFTVNDDIQFDVVPYLDGGSRAAEQLAFHNPKGLSQAELISLLKQQGFKQDVHLTTIASSSKTESKYGSFFKLG